MLWGVSAVLVVVMLAGSAWAWGRVPPGQPVAVHWGLNRQPDGFARRSVALLVVPALAVGLLVLLLLLAGAVPRAAAVLAWTGLPATALLAVAHAVIIRAALRKTSR